MAQRETITVTRRGRAAAFIVSVRDMEELLDARRRRSRAVADLKKVMRRAKFRAWLSDELRQEFVAMQERNAGYPRNPASCTLISTAPLSI